MSSPKTSLKQTLFLQEDEKQQSYWMLDDTHFLKPLSPLFASFMLPAVTLGTQRAFENMKMPYAQFIVKLDHGYYYQTLPPHPEPYGERMSKHRKKMEELYPRIRAYMDRVVDELYLPFYRQLEERAQRRLSLAEALQYVEELRQFYPKAWQYHFEITIPRTALAIALEEAYGQATGAADTKEVYTLLQGVMNMTLEINRGLWLLAQQAKSSPVLRSVLASSGNPAGALEESAEGRGFLQELRDFLSIYGHRSALIHSFTEKTWYENPSAVLPIIAGYMQEHFDFDAELAQAAAQRRARVEELFAGLPASGQTRRLQTLYEWALDCWGVDEDHHFYIDAMLAAKSRYFLKNIGRTLVEHHVIADDEDIFFLYLDELMDVLQAPRPLHQTAEENKRQYEEFLRVCPAPSFGPAPQQPVDSVMEGIFGWPQGERRDRVKEISLTGYGASAGTYTGTVKVIHGQEDFAKLEKGDILVCKSTTPPWTVLFPIAGALVTDAGGILSHACIVAREYRLPAVVGTREATSLLKDGDRVTVDGTNGIVFAAGNF